MMGVGTGNWLVALGRVSAEAGVLVLLVLLVQTLLRKQLPPRWRCALWLIVVARLLLPVSFASVVSIFNLVPPLTPPVVQSTPPERPVALSPGQTQPVSAPRGSAEAVSESTLNPSTLDTPALQGPRPLPSPGAQPTARETASQTSRTRRLHPVSWVQLVFVIWLGGALVLGVYVLIGSIRLAQRLAGLPPMTDPAVLEILSECRRLLRIRSRLMVVESPEISTPALHGLWRLRLLLPRGFARAFTRAELRFVLLHELAHVKRRDILMNWLITVLQIIHWFNPLLWLGFARWRADRELACDALALEAAGPGENKEYGKTILRLLKGFTHHVGAPGLVGILESKRQLRERIGMIASFQPRKKWTLLSALLLGLLAASGLTDARTDAARSNDVPVASEVNPTNQGATSLADSASSRLQVTNGPVMKVTVLDAQSGRPLPGAEVRAPDFATFFGEEKDAPLWKTDTSGVAIIHLGEVPSQHLAVRTWFALSVRLKGYAPRGMSWSAENRDVRPEMPPAVTVRLDRGLTAGGVVRNEAGEGVAGVRVRIFGTAYWQGQRDEFSEFWSGLDGSTAVVTDAAGRWQVNDFPRDLDIVTVDLISANGSGQRFRHTIPSRAPIDDGEPLDSTALRANRAVFVVKAGFPVRGVVLDPGGTPLPNVLVKVARGAVNQVQVGEVETDSAGRFRLTDRQPGQLILTACPHDFALTSRIVDVNSNTPEVRLRVGPLQPLHIRVLQDGHPAEGAKVTVDSYRTEGQVLDFDGATDASGQLTWTNAPDSSYALVATTPALHQKMWITPGQHEVTFTLRAGMENEVRVFGRAHDTRTGLPVALKSVAWQTADREHFPWEGDIHGSEFRLTVAGTHFRTGGFYPSYQLRLQAAGYADLITPWRDFDEGDWHPDFALEPGSNPGGTVLLPNGQPVVGAEISVPTREPGFLMYVPGRAPGNGDGLVRSDEKGHFEIHNPGANAIVLITSEQGFLQTTVDQLKQQPNLKLPGWGRVEGILRAGTNVQAHADMGIMGGGRVGMSSWRFDFRTTTDEQGHFSFDKIPPGEDQLYRDSFKPNSGRMVHGYQTPVSIRPGEVTRVEYGGNGRKIIGSVDENADWHNDPQVLELKLPPGPLPPRLGDFATVEAFNHARDAFYEGAQARRESAQRTYQLQFNRDDSFHIDDVPPGTYELRIRVTEPRKQGAPWTPPEDLKEIASLTREVVVPPMPADRSEAPMDLGLLHLNWKQPPVARAVIDFSAQSLEGKPINISNWRGRYVLLAFWASWSQRCSEELAELQKLESDFGQDDRLVILGVSVDEDLASARQAVDERSYTWTQAWLDAAGRTKTTAALDVSSLPAVFLLDPQGHIVGRDLTGDQLQSAVHRALAKQ